jgi:saccharopine dehydrogenase-like NADP-dependent oxidoreductase
LLQKVLLKDVTCVIHTAGPYCSDERSPTVLDAVIAEKIPVYVYVSDPIPFLEASPLAKNEEAIESQTTALCAAGAFPGMSNVLGMEAAATAKCTDESKIKDIRFHYFTKGLGGSGTINL